MGVIVLSNECWVMSGIEEWRVEQTRSLRLECPFDNALYARVCEWSLAASTSMPDEVVSEKEMTLAHYPSIEAASKVLEYLSQGEMKASFHPLRTVSQNWQCEECEYRNYGRRARCYRCDRAHDEGALNCSLMVRGSVLIDLHEEMVREAFQRGAPVKDLRLIKNKLTGKNKDFCFVQFASPQDTVRAYRHANDPIFRLAGQRVLVLYSRNRIDEDLITRTYKLRAPQGDNYYNRQRKMEIEEIKNRPPVTIQQLQLKKKEEMEKNKPQIKNVSQEQTKRKEAETLAKAWEREMKAQQMVLFLCTVCSRKFKTEEEMQMHALYSQRHRFRENQLLKGG